MTAPPGQPPAWPVRDAWRLAQWHRDSPGRRPQAAPTGGPTDPTRPGHALTRDIALTDKDHAAGWTVDAVVAGADRARKGSTAPEDLEARHLHTLRRKRASRLRRLAQQEAAEAQPDATAAPAVEPRVMFLTAATRARLPWAAQRRLTEQVLRGALVIVDPTAETYLRRPRLTGAEQAQGWTLRRAADGARRARDGSRAPEDLQAARIWRAAVHRGNRYAQQWPRPEAARR